MNTLTDFLLDRIAEDEEAARLAIGGQADPENGWGYEGRALTPHVGVIHHAAQAEHITRWHPARVLADCEAKRRIIGLHQDWPVLVEGPETNEFVDGGLDTMTYRVARQMAWLTTREYVARFGTEPPTTPVLRALAQPYADHPDYQPEWSTND